MTYIQYTDFKNHTKDYFNQIEKGEELIIVRHGIPIAKVLPFVGSKQKGWKREIAKIKLNKKSKTLDQIIRRDRDVS
ncbi:MAG: type II toxin-antitoxin system Phd/YefM family antitoxin [Leptospira sp.]|nr:type II toxin-antitoxin system Phd/YefM family antitoxin [Leptospira sp.]